MVEKKLRSEKNPKIYIEDPALKSSLGLYYYHKKEKHNDIIRAGQQNYFTFLEKNSFIICGGVFFVINVLFIV